MSKRRTLAYALVWTSFYEQLGWTALLVQLAAAAGDPESVAILASVYSLANLLGNMLFGLLSDRLDRFRVAGGGLLAMAVTGALHLVASTPALLIGIRFLHGLSASAVAPAALASATDGLERNRRGEVMARVGLVIATASMLATSLTGRLATGLGTRPTVMILAVAMALVGGVTLLLRPRLEPVTLRRAAAGEPDSSSVNRGMLVAASLVAFALMFLQNVLFYAYPLRTRALGMSPALMGGTLSLFAVGAVVAFVPPLSRVPDRWGRHLPLMAGMALAGFALLGLARAETIGTLSAALLLYGLGYGLVFPAVTALNADAAGQGRRGLAFGILTAAFSLGSITGPVVTRALGAYAPPFTVAGWLAVGTAVMTGLWYLLARPAAG